MMKKADDIHWLSDPKEHDCPAAESYLRLLCDEASAGAHVEKLKRAPIVEFKAKDLFRVSGLSLLGVSNSHVEKDRRKIEKGEGLSPLLLVRESARGRAVVADSYHRLRAVYSIDEDALIPCKIV